MNDYLYVKTVGELIDALATLPRDLRVMTTDTEYAKDVVIRRGRVSTDNTFFSHTSPLAPVGASEEIVAL